ncbi:MAG TPA: hypothetical protein VKZ63_05080 [Kofleriaceae bacterium]|nr:hypothetical protein [Kofleriaceae bacterium]
MRRLGIGLLDVSAAVLVLIVLVMPGRDLHVATAYRQVEPEDLASLTAEVAEAQARLVADPADGAAAEKLAMLLARRPVNQHDQALRLAGAAAARESSPTRWRALWAVSLAHADLLEIEDAHRQAALALEACRAAPAACPAHEEQRLALYTDRLAAGVEAIARGADPRVDPERFRQELSRIHPTATYRSRPRRVRD